MRKQLRTIYTALNAPANRATMHWYLLWQFVWNLVLLGVIFLGPLDVTGVRVLVGLCALMSLRSLVEFRQGSFSDVADAD